MRIIRTLTPWLAALPLISAGATGPGAQEISPIQQCIDSAIVTGHMRLTHVQEISGDVVGRNEWVIRCDGQVALRAWDQFFTFRRSDPVPAVERDGTETLVLSNGDSSRCTKVLKAAGGRAKDSVTCEISLDLRPDLQQGFLLGR